LHVRGGLLRALLGFGRVPRVLSRRRLLDPHAPEAFDAVAEVRHNPGHPIAHLGRHLVGLDLDRSPEGRRRRVVGVGGDQGQRQDRNHEECEGETRSEFHGVSSILRLRLSQRFPEVLAGASL
jgi:hypothetical protein